MTRYFFDIRDDGNLYRDEEGLEMPSQKAAEIEAAQTLAGLARDAVTPSNRSDVAIEVRTETEPVFHAALIFQTNKTKQ